MHYSNDSDIDFRSGPCHQQQQNTGEKLAIYFFLFSQLMQVLQNFFGSFYSFYRIKELIGKFTNQPSQKHNTQN